MDLTAGPVAVRPRARGKAMRVTDDNWGAVIEWMEADLPPESMIWMELRHMRKEFFPSGCYIVLTDDGHFHRLTEERYQADFEQVGA